MIIYYPNISEERVVFANFLPLFFLTNVINKKFNFEKICHVNKVENMGVKDDPNSFETRYTNN